MDIFEMIKNSKIRKRRIIVGIIIGAFFLLVLFPIFSKFFEDTISSEIISQTAIKGVATIDGGNNYQEIKDDSGEEDLMLRMLSESESWNTSVQASREQQIQWYKTLSKYLEETYLQKLESSDRKTPNYLANATYTKCDRENTGDYANDECDFNGPVDNEPVMKRAGDPTGAICGGTILYEIIDAKWKYYISNDTINDVGGKILGLYPDVLANATFANTYYTLDQNYNEEAEKNKDLLNNVTKKYEELEKICSQDDVFISFGIPIMHVGECTLKSILGSMMKKILTWYEGSEKAAVITKALDDTFTEGSIYTTFDFSMESECEPVDAFGYHQIGSLPCGDMTHLDTGKEVAEEYDCIMASNVPYDCDVTIDIVYNSDGTKREVRTETPVYKKTDGSPNTYYYTYNNNQIGEDAEIPYEFPKLGTFTDNDHKVCNYIWEGGELNPPYVDSTKCLRKHKGSFYKRDMYWICSPVKDKTIEGIKCTPTPYKDGRKQIIYYYCSDVNLNDIRRAIVDPVLNAYENNTLKLNKYNAEFDEDGNVVENYLINYIYPDTEEGIAKKEQHKNEVNPEGYRIDEYTRDIIAKHIQLEILGGIEGRSPVICDKEGNFSLQSYNRVLNPMQYKDALISTLTEKDNIIRHYEPEKFDAEHYSENIFGVFYSEYNEAFNGWSGDAIATQKRLDQSKKHSFILEVFSTYEYITGYLLEHGLTSLTGITSLGGNGLNVADACGYQQRTGGPRSTDKNYNFNADNYGECAWYAFSRVNEILDMVGSSNDWTTSGDGWQWCDVVADTENYIRNYNFQEPKKGSIVSWSNGGFGHVAIVEDVFEKDGTKYVTISEGGLGFAMSKEEKEAIWALKFGTEENTKARLNKCGSTISKCFYTETLSVEQLKSKYGNFNCYVYLLNDNDQLDENGQCIGKKPRPSGDNSGNDDDGGSNGENNDNDGDESNGEDGVNDGSTDGNIEVPADASEDDKKIIELVKYAFENAFDDANSKIEFYNYAIKTEGGTQISKAKLSDINFLKQEITIGESVEDPNMLAIEPGYNIGKVGTTVSINVNGTQISVSLSKGKKISRWQALCLWVYKAYVPVMQQTEKLLKGRKLSSLGTNMKYFLVKYSYVYGSTWRQEKILETYFDTSLTDREKEEKIWCDMSLYLRGIYTTSDGKQVSAVYTHYFNGAEIYMDMYFGKERSSVWHNDYRYYTKEWIDIILKNVTNQGYVVVGNLNTLRNSTYSSSNKNYDCKKYYDINNLPIK